MMEDSWGPCVSPSERRGNLVFSELIWKDTDPLLV